MCCVFMGGGVTHEYPDISKKQTQQTHSVKTFVVKISFIHLSSRVYSAVKYGN